MSPVHFETFALPPGVAAPLGPLGTVEEEGVSLSCVAATPAWIDTLTRVLTDSRAALSGRGAREISKALGEVGERFLDPTDPVRQKAVELLPPTSGLSAEMSEAVLDGMARDWTGPELARLLETEFGDPSALDGFTDGRGRRAMAVGPQLCVQFAAGTVPGVGVSALIRSLLVKGPTLLKPGRGDIVLPVLFARALEEADATLAAALAVVYWPGGSRLVEGTAVSRADLVTVYGSDETVSELRTHVPLRARFVAYPHRVSVGIVGREALTPERTRSTATQVARSVAMFDQRGCVSPQLLFVEEGGASSPEAFVESLAAALAELEASLPGGRLDVHEASTVHQARGTAELMAASGVSVRVIHGGTAAWTVVFEAEPGPLVAAVGRVVRVRPVPDADALPPLLRPIRGRLQTVGVAGMGARIEALARSMGELGACRIAPFSSVAFPPPWWHHDGGSPLLDLVRWIDLDE